MSARSAGWIGALVSVYLLGSAGSAGAGSAPGLLDWVGTTRGVCVLVGDQECQRAIELARQSELALLVCLAKDSEVAAACKAADAERLFGTRIFVAKQAPGKIGLADNLADAVVVADGTQVPKEEVLRVLRPGGKARSGRETWVKPAAEGVDDWTHHYHSPDNNPQSGDRVARFPYLTQFIAEPRYAPGPQCVVSSAGRVFMAFGHVAWHEREEPMLNTLLAVNGYNGALLWKRPLVPGIMVDRSTMVATPEALYLADHQSCKVLDPATGAVIDEIVPPAEAVEGTFWKWMALEGGVLYALIGQQEPLDEDAKWGSKNHGWPWTGISKGYNADEYRWGFSKTLVAIDPKSKKVLWSRREDPAIDSRTLALHGGRLYFGHFGRYFAALEATTGKPIWRKTAEKDAEVFQAIGPYRPGHGYIGGWKSTVYLKATDQALYVVGPQVEWLTGLSTEDGRVLFKHPAKDLHIVVRDDGLYTIGPQNSKDATKKLDPLTGRVLAEYMTSRRACTRSTGSADGIFFRSEEGSGRFDVAEGQTRWISAMRPSCHVGVIIANGQLYWIPWACDCNLQMFGMISLGPARGFDFASEAKSEERLEKGADRGGAALQAAASDWPTFRGDSRRRAVSSATLPQKVRLAWKASAAKAVELTAPVIAGGLVFVAGHDGVVRALDAASGQVRWTAYTGGAVRYPPTIAEGRALVGSADGWVYAFEATTGRQLWRFRAAPADRRIPVYGALASTWPVASGVLVQDGVAYFAAGMFDLDGTHVYALDAATGAIRWQNNSSGHLDRASRRGVTCQGEMLLDAGKLYLAGGNAVSPAVFDAKTGECLSAPPSGNGSKAPRGRELRLVKGSVQVSGQPLYSRKETPVFDRAVEWSDVAVSMANGQLALGPRRQSAGGGWELAARDAGGKTLWSEELPDEPVRWGVAVDAERMLVVLRRGDILCFKPTTSGKDRQP